MAIGTAQRDGVLFSPYRTEWRPGAVLYCPRPGSSVRRDRAAAVRGPVSLLRRLGQPFDDERAVLVAGVLNLGLLDDDDLHGGVLVL